MHRVTLHTCDLPGSISSNDIPAISSEENFDQLTMLAAKICETPIAAVAILDKTLQRFQSIFGVSMTEMADALSFITNTIRDEELFVVQDASKCPLFANVPLVVGERELRFCAGAPLISCDGTILGMLAVIDYVPRTLTKTQIEALQTFADQVTMQLELCQRRSLTESRDASRAQSSAILVDHQQSWQDNEELFHLMVDSVKDYGIYMLDTHGYVRSWNAGAERFKGFQAEEIIGKHFSTFYTKGDLDQDKPAAGLQAAIADGRFEGEGWRVRKDGSQFWANVVITALCDETGQLRGFSKVTRDITERKKAEDDIIQLNADLEQRVCDRTAQIIAERKQAEEKIREVNAQLEQRVRTRTAELEAANKELESFSYSVSHDLRAPLRHVQGYAEMLAAATAGQLSDKAQRYLQTISDASADMGQLIDDLLAFSRMGRVDLRKDCVNLDQIVHETIRDQEMMTQGRDITWNTAPLPQVIGDLPMLKQVLVNLIGNAVKYTRKRGSAEIQIGYAGEDGAQGVFFVRDNGAGFDMQYVHKLFGVFQRLHRADEFEGTGIGLAIVRRTVARHGGRTWAEGKVGEGATFYFTLQRVIAN